MVVPEYVPCADIITEKINATRAYEQLVHAVKDFNDILGIIYDKIENLDENWISPSGEIKKGNLQKKFEEMETYMDRVTKLAGQLDKPSIIVETEQITQVDRTPKRLG